MKFKQLLFCFAGVVVLSFLLNFFWESLHGYSLYEDHIIDSDKYVRMMLYMAFMDAVTILGIYVFIALLQRDFFWLKSMRKKEIFYFLVLGLVVAVAAEYWAVYVSQEWRYSEFMPLIFGIGLSPFFQLSVTGLLAVWLTRKFI